LPHHLDTLLIGLNHLSEGTHIRGTPVHEEHDVVLQLELQVEGSLPLRLKLQMLACLPLHRVHTLHSDIDWRLTTLSSHDLYQEITSFCKKGRKGIDNLIAVLKQTNDNLIEMQRTCS